MKGYRRFDDSEIRMINERIALRAADGYGPDENDIALQLEILRSLHQHLRDLAVDYRPVFISWLQARLCGAVMDGGVAQVTNEVWDEIRIMQKIREMVQ